MGKVVVVLLSNDAAGQMWDAMANRCVGVQHQGGRGLANHSTYRCCALFSAIVHHSLHPAKTAVRELQ